MKKMNFTSIHALGWVMIVFLSLLGTQQSKAQCGMACNDLVRISITPDNFISNGIFNPCSAQLNVDMLIESPQNLWGPTASCPVSYAIIKVKRGNRVIHTSGPLFDEDQITSFDGSSYLDMTLGTEVHIYDVNDNELNYCWGEIILEDKARPVFDCPSTAYVINCTEDPNSIPAPRAYDNCDNAVQVNLVNEEVTGDACTAITYERTYIAIDAHGNVSEPCTILILVGPTLVQFPDDITWTCEQYAAYSTVIDPTPLHYCIKDWAAQMDKTPLCCIVGLDGDDVFNVDPYGPGPYWLDAEDLDVTLDPNYDDNIDNPLTDSEPNVLDPATGLPVFSRLGTPTAEVDNQTGVCNTSLQVGCQYLDTFIDFSTHVPDTFIIPRYLPFNPITGTPISGLEDADVLELTGSGVPNVSGTPCQFAVTHIDQRIEACQGIDKFDGPVFKIIRTWTVLNWCTGKTQTDIQVIKVMDKKKPTIEFKDDFIDVVLSNQTGVGPHGQCGSNGLLDLPFVKDNCTGIEDIRVFTPAGEGTPVYNGNDLVGFSIPSPYLPLGFHTVTYEATDGCGNFTTADVQIEVIDGIPPVPVCREVTQVALSNGTDGQITVGAEFFDEGSYDQCGNVRFKVRRMDDACSGYDIPFDPSNEVERFQDEIHFCCEDIGKTVNVILRVYDIDVPAGPVYSSFGEYYVDGIAYSNYNDCMIEVLVEDKLRPNCVPPADVWTDCAVIPSNVDLNDTTDLQTLFGNATAYDNCEAYTVELTPDVDVDICGIGSITRRWRALDAYGNTSVGLCRQTIMIMPITDYRINIPADVDGECEEVDDNLLTTEDNGCDLMAVSIEDDSLFTEPGACYKILRTYQIINWCEYDGFSDPVELHRLDITPAPGDGMYGDAYYVVSDGEWIYFNGVPNYPVNVWFASTGFYTYTQHIKVFDDTAPVLTDPVTGPFCGGDLDEPICTGQVDITPGIDENCTDTDTEYAVDANNDGTYDITRTAGVLSQRLPLGSHRVHYWVSDKCGNTSEIDILFDVVDCKKPTPVCINGLSVDLMASGMVEIWAKDWNASSYDYCTPEDELKFRVNRIEDQNGDGTIDDDDHQATVPVQDSVVFRCKDLGYTYVQMWVGDNAGNWDYCVTFVEVQDNLGACSGTKLVGGKITTEDNENVSDVAVELSGNLNNSVLTTNDGDYTFSIPEGVDVSITPSKDIDARNGVSTYDLVLISKHILNVEPLNNPYKVIAADANNSGNVSTLDLLALRKLILRVADNLPNNTSWRFVDKSWAFADVNNPWTTAFPEVINFNDLALSDLEANFTAIKVGDVNGNAKANSLTSVDNRSFNGTLVFTSVNQSVKAGEEFTVDFKASEAVQGYQFTLNLDNKAVELVDIVEGIAKEGNFAVVSEGTITTSWNADVSRGFGKGAKMFSLVLRAKSDIEVSNIMNVSSEYTAAEAYNTAGEYMGVALDFNNGAVATAGFELYQNTPNPFMTETSIGFNLPEACTATISVSDVSGKVLKVVKGNYAKGYNKIELTRNEIGASTGVLSYQLDTPTHSATMQMIIVK